MNRHHQLGILTTHCALAEALERQLSCLDRFTVHRYDSVDACRQALPCGGISLLIADVGYESPGLHDLLVEARNCAMRLILLGLDPSRGEGQRYLELEADSSLPLETTCGDLVAAIDQVLEGEKIYPPSIAYMLYQRLAQKAVDRDLRLRLAALTLTRRELEILRLVAERCSNKTIASRLGISIYTVKNHVHNILDKLQVDNRASAAELASTHGWIEPQSFAPNRPGLPEL